MKASWKTGCAWILWAGLVGCESPLRPIFPPIDPPIVWPRPPDPPRIRYVGQLRGQADLGVQPQGWAAVRAIVEGPPPTIGFSTPTAVAVAGQRVYVADGQAACVYVLDLAARGFAAIRQAGDEPLLWPADLALADGMLAVADARRQNVFLFGLEAAAEGGRYIGSLGAGVLQRPAAVAWSPTTSEFWIVDAALHQCLVFDRAGELRRRIGVRGSQPGEFNYPTGLALGGAAEAVVADSMNFRVQVLSLEGVFVRGFGQKGDAAGDFALPRDVALDSEGHHYVLDSQFENVQIFSAEGGLLMAFGQEGRNPGEFYLPSGITIDELDRIWIADTYNRRVQVFQYLREDET